MQGNLAYRYGNQRPVATLVMEQDRTWNLFALKLAGKASPEEWAELQLLIEDKPEIALHLQALTNFWHRHSRYDRERIEKAVKKIAESYARQNEISANGARVLNAAAEPDSVIHKKENNRQFHFLSDIKRQLNNYLVLVWNKINRQKVNSRFL